MEWCIHLSIMGIGFQLQTGTESSFRNLTKELKLFVMLWREDNQYCSFGLSRLRGLIGKNIIDVCLPEFPCYGSSLVWVTADLMRCGVEFIQLYVLDACSTLVAIWSGLKFIEYNVTLFWRSGSYSVICRTFQKLCVSWFGSWCSIWPSLSS